MNDEQDVSRCPLARAIDEIFNLHFSGDIGEFEQMVWNKVRSAIKTFDNDKFWAANLFNDRMLKTAQVRVRYRVTLAPQAITTLRRP